jgi:hypothetical protein
MVNVIDGRFSYTQTYFNGVPLGLGDGYTASEKGFKIFLWWEVHFRDGADQTYLAIVHLKGGPCEEHGWVYSRGVLHVWTLMNDYPGGGSMRDNGDGGSGFDRCVRVDFN